MTDADRAELLAMLTRCHETMTRMPIPGLPGYEADTEGFIWSVASNWRGYGKRRLSTVLNKSGYQCVHVKRDGHCVRLPVHKLVAIAFHGAPENGKQVRHLDGNKENNRSENLAWGTAKENAIDRDLHNTTARGQRHGSHTKPDRRARGERNAQAKLNAEKVKVIRALLAEGEKQEALARRFGVHQGVISGIKRGTLWVHVS